MNRAGTGPGTARDSSPRIDGDHCPTRSGDRWPNPTAETIERARGWSYTLAVTLGEIQGKYMLTHDGEEVGMLSLLDQVQHQPQLLQRIIDALNSTDRNEHR